LSRYIITALPFLIVHILILFGRMSLKRKVEDSDYPAAKRAKLMDCEETAGSLGNIPVVHIQICYS
jgi:hypothetical protein